MLALSRLHFRDSFHHQPHLTPMALVSKSSFIPTTNEFLAHWTDVNASLPSGPGFTLPAQPGIIPPGFNISGLTALRDLLLGQLDEVQEKLNDVQIMGSSIKLLKAAIYKRLTLFLEVVDGFYPLTEFYAARPEAPGIGAGEGKFLDAMRDMKSLWAKLNAATAPGGLTLPIVLNEGTQASPVTVTLAQYNTTLALLVTKYADLATAQQELKMSRGRRDRTMEEIRAALVSYRVAVLFPIAGNAALIDSIPRISPEPGHTPAPVSASATFQAPDMARVAHTESDDSDFKEYQLRATIGDDGDTEDAVLLATHAARTPAEFTTQFGLGSPGGAVSLWVYVVTSDGNERASNRVVVERPV